MPNSDIPILDFDIAANRRLACDHIKSLRGQHYFDTRKYRGDKTNEQLGYYFGVVLVEVAREISSLWGEEDFDSLKAHAFLKEIFLKELVINKNTGKEMGYIVKSVATLDVKEMSVYLDNIIKFAAEKLSYIVTPPKKHRPPK